MFDVCKPASKLFGLAGCIGSELDGVLARCSKCFPVMAKIRRDASVLPFLCVLCLLFTVSSEMLKLALQDGPDLRLQIDQIDP